VFDQQRGVHNRRYIIVERYRHWNKQAAFWPYGEEEGLRINQEGPGRRDFGATELMSAKTVTHLHHVPCNNDGL
jgi:hypothetical protein